MYKKLKVYEIQENILSLYFGKKSLSQFECLTNKFDIFMKNIEYTEIQISNKMIIIKLKNN